MLASRFSLFASIPLLAIALAPGCKKSGDTTTPDEAPPSEDAPAAMATAPVEEAAPAVPDGCDPLAGCRDAASAALEAGDVNGAVERARYGCDAEDMGSCAVLGKLVATGVEGAPDIEGGLVLLDRACKGGEGFACVDAATIVNDQLRDSTLAASYLDLGCGLDDATACGVLALFYNEGVGVPKDPQKTLELMQRSCSLGREDACKAVKDLEEQESQRVPGANLKVGSMEADGLKVQDFQCRVDGGGALFGTLAVVGVLAKRKKALDKCAPKGEAPDVSWTFRKGKTIDIVVDNVDPKVGACVKKAMAKVPAPLEGQCAATILIGKRAGAEAKAAAKAK